MTLTSNNDTSVALNLGDLTRTALGNGTVHFNLIPVSGSKVTVSSATSINGAGIFGGWATINSTSTLVDWATKNGSNEIVPYASASYTNLTTAGGGTLATTNFNSAAGATVTLTGSTTANSLRISATATTLALVATKLTINSGAGGILYAPSTGTATISGTAVVASGNGMITTGTSTGGELFIYVNGTGTLNIGAGIGGISGTNGFRLVKSGTGTLNLTNTTANGLNNYTGSTVINGGTLGITAISQLGNTSGAIVLNGGTLNLTTTIAAIANPLTLGLGGGTNDS